MRWLKWLTLALLSYAGLVFTVHLDWWTVAGHVFQPQLAFNYDMLLLVVAVFGTTISPYLFFWQAAQEMEDTRRTGPRTQQDVRRQLRRIKADTIIGMTFSNLIAFFVIVRTAATLHAAGVTDIQTSAQAAEALRPGWGVHVPSFQPGQHRHGHARGPGVGRLGRLRRG